MKLCKNESIVNDSSSSNSGQTFINASCNPEKPEKDAAAPESSAVREGE